MRIRTVLALAATLAAAGCSSDSPAETQANVEQVHSSGLATPTTTTAGTTTASGQEKSPRGNLIKQVGQAAGIGQSAERQEVTFTVDSITVDPPCTSPVAEKPRRGHYVVIQMTLKTTSLFDPAVSATFSEYDFSVTGADGITETAVTSVGLCFDYSETLPGGHQWAPASQYQGKVVMDTKHAAGVIALRPQLQGGGWEWAFPAA